MIAGDNLHRRHLNESQRGMVGARMANLKNGTNRHDLAKPMGQAAPAITMSRAAELSGSSVKNIQRAKPIVQSGCTRSTITT